MQVASVFRKYVERVKDTEIGNIFNLSSIPVTFIQVKYTDICYISGFVTNY